MFAWIAENAVTIIVAAVVFAAVILAVVKIIKDKKKGAVCSSGCAGCSCSGDCAHK